jgi:thioredoxin 1
MPSKNVIELDDSNFETAATASPVPVLVDFTAVRCPPCRAIMPHIEAIADAYQGRLRVGRCDVDSNVGLAARFDVRSVPTLLVLKHGAVVGQLVGARPRGTIEALVQKALG